jgi:hypothetical protein
MSATYNVNNNQFEEHFQDDPNVLKKALWAHSSQRESRIYMRSPILHVGQLDTALHRPGIPHKMRLHPDAQIHHELLDDSSANKVHAMHSWMTGTVPSTEVAHGGNYLTGPKFMGSTQRGRKTQQEVRDLVMSEAEDTHLHHSLEALDQGKIVPYYNQYEGGTSLLVPNPRRNLRHLTGPAADPNRVLPDTRTTIRRKAIGEWAREDDTIRRRKNMYGDGPASTEISDNHLSNALRSRWQRTGEAFNAYY